MKSCHQQQLQTVLCARLLNAFSFRIFPTAKTHFNCINVKNAAKNVGNIATCDWRVTAFLPTCFNGFFTWLTPWAMRTSRMLDIKEHQCKCSTCKWNLKLNLIRSLPSQTFIQLMEILLQAGTQQANRARQSRAGQGRRLCGQLTTQCMLRLRPAAPPFTHLPHLLDCISQHWTKFVPQH